MTPEIHRDVHILLRKSVGIMSRIDYSIAVYSPVDGGGGGGGGGGKLPPGADLRGVPKCLDGKVSGPQISK